MAETTLEKWLGDRGISTKTSENWPVAAGTVRFGDGKHDCAVFGYFRNGERVNWKARPLDHKDYRQEKGGKARFWNLDRVLDGPQDVIYIVEGEVDALSLAEAGIPEHAILSVPNGAPSQQPEKIQDSAKFAYVLDALDEGLKPSKAVLACDNDEPGRYLRQGLATILGKARCAYVDWPDGVKDANELLCRDGADALRRHVTEQQQPWPIVGLYGLDELPEPPELELWKPGFPEWENKVRLAPTMLSVLTGRPGHGKSHFAQQLWHQIAREHQIRVAVFSAETPSKPYIRRYQRQFYHGKLERDMDDEERVFADEWIREHFVFMQHPNARPTFGWLMDTIEAAAQRHGCRAAIVDPWNKLEADFDPGHQRETQWIGDCLDTMLDAARALNLHLMIVAHPTKPDSERRRQAPDLYDISGSQHWNNRVDQGFTMHRPTVVGEDGSRHTEADFYQRKARFEELGHPCKLKMDLNLETGAYESIDYREW